MKHYNVCAAYGSCPGRMGQRTWAVPICSKEGGCSSIGGILFDGMSCRHVRSFSAQIFFPKVSSGLRDFGAPLGRRGGAGPGD